MVLYVLPGGLSQLVYRVRDRALKALARRRGVHVPSLLEDSLQVDDELPVPPEPEAVDDTLVSDREPALEMNP